MTTDRSIEFTQSFDEVAEDLPVGIITLNRHGVVIGVNRSMLWMLGYTRQEYVGRHISDCHVDEPLPDGLLQRLMRDRIIRNDRIQFRCKDNTVRTFLFSASGAFVDGQFMLARCIVQNRNDFDEAGPSVRHLKAHFEAVLDATELGIYGIDLHGRCIFINEVAAKLLGQRQDRLLGQPIHELIRCTVHDDSPAPAHSGGVDAGFRPAHGCPAEGMTLWRNNGVTIPIEYSSYPIVEDGDIAGTVVVFTDVTVRRQSIQKQRNNVEVFRQLARHSREVFWVADQKSKRMLYVSPGYEQTWGRSSESLYITPDSWFEHVHQDDKERTLGLDVKCQMDLGYDAQYRIVRPDGSIRWIHDRAFPVRDEAGLVQRLAGIAEDITEYKLVNAALQNSLSHSQALSSYMEKTREEERSRIGQEVHDNLGNILTYLKLDLTRLGNELLKKDGDNLSAHLKNKVEAMVEATDVAIRTVQRVGMDLRPVLLEQFGLAAALDRQAKEFERRTGIQCWLEENLDIDPVEQNHAVLLFRIVQEALTNVARHAQATEVMIILKNQNENVFLIVDDNGKGIPEHALSDPTSFGLMGMRERARLAGGVLSFDSSGRKGTRVTVRVHSSVLKDGGLMLTSQAQTGDGTS